MVLDSSTVPAVLHKAEICTTVSIIKKTLVVDRALWRVGVQ